MQIFTKYLLITLLILSSCIPEEEKVIAPAALDYSQFRFSESIYERSIYFDFGSAQTVYSTDLNNWDIAFDCNEDSHYVLFNYSRNVRGFKTEYSRLEEAFFISDTFFIEEPTGVDDSFVGDWWKESDTSNVYLIQGTSIGDIKVRFYLDDDVLKLNIFSENDERIIDAEIPKRSGYNYNYLSLENPETTFINEPMKDEWDIVLTQYTEYVPYDDTTLVPAQYIVRGVLSNKENNTESIKIDWDFGFDDINISNINEIWFSEDKNEIGYDWKSYSIEENAYVVNPNLKFILKDREGEIYKFRFIDFNSESGERGFPLIEFGKL